MFIDTPLFLVSQIQRSGGSLLAQLFDGHPQLYAHPNEIRIGHPQYWDWPLLDPADDPQHWFELLRNDKWVKFAKVGLAKTGKNRLALDRYPFTFSEDEQRTVFLELVGSRPVGRQREILNCYFTSFFRSWHEWRPTGREVALAGFTPRLVMLPDSLARFRSDYDDGKLITIVRDPRSWYASWSRHKSGRADVRLEVAVWIQSARAARELVGGRDNSTLGLIFEDLVLDPERVMRNVASFLGIEFLPSLLEPSFLGRPVLPNSSFRVSEYGINPAMARRENEISGDAREYIEAEALPLYEEIAELLAPAVTGPKAEP
jgi:hypothetical protein